MLTAQLAQQHLRPTTTCTPLLGRANAPAIARAVAHTGVGLDHTTGEQPLAVLHEEYSAANNPMEANAVVTDRRVFGRLQNKFDAHAAFEIPFAGLTSIRFKKGLLTIQLDVTVHNQPVKVTCFLGDIGDFLQALGAAPAHARISPLPGLSATPDDPAGLHAAVQLLAAQDPRPSTILRALFQEGRHPAEEVIARAWQVVLLDRALRAGRGQSGQAWISLLPRPELARAWSALLGTPVAAYPSPEADTFDFAIEAHGGSNLASNVAGLALLAATGFGWVTTGGGAPLRIVRLTIHDAPFGSAFFLQGLTQTFQPLHVTHPRTLDALFAALLDLEARYLLAQTLLDPATPPPELLGAAPEALYAEAHRRLGPTDLGAFFSRR